MNKIKKIEQFLETQSKDEFKGSHSVYTPLTIVDSITSKINLKNRSILVLFNVEFVADLVYNKKVKPSQITFYSDNSKKTEVVKLFGVKKIINKLELMEFDVVIGNPPFNVRADDDTTKTGVSGKTNLFKDFVKKCIKLVKKDGYFAFITPKMIINELQRNTYINQFELIEMNWMSDLDVWKYDTCYFILKNNKKGLDLKLSDRIFNKFIDLKKENTWSVKNINLSDSELVKKECFGNGQKVIRYLPGKKGPKLTYDNSNDQRIVFGPKVIATALDSLSSITPTSEPALVGTANYFIMESLLEAEKFSLFLKNNNLVKLMKKKLKFKKSFQSVKYFKKFDLGQIKTGKEYPVEYNLTPDEISEIESIIN
jgi:hypothetical protein